MLIVGRLHDRTQPCACSRVLHPRGCHPERSVAESKDLRFGILPQGWDSTKPKGSPYSLSARNRAGM